MDERVIIEGNWLARGTSLAHSARLVLAHANVTAGIVEFDDAASEPVEIEAVSDRIGTVDRRIEMTDGSVFVTSDNAAIDRLTAARGSLFSRVFSLETVRPRLFVFAFAAVVMVAGLLRYGVPVLAQVAAWATPIEVAQVMDASARNTLESLFFSPSKLEEQTKGAFQADFERLVEASGDEANYTLLFRDGGRLGPNALALPAGTIVVTDQLVRLGTHEEVVAVLAHEVAHVMHDHSLQQLYRAFGFAALVTLIAGDIGAAGEEILGGGGVLVAMAASREMEEEADAEGVRLVQTIGGNPTALVTVLDKIYDAVCGDVARDVCEETSWWSTHPGAKERREALRAAIDALP
ncbi:MAG: M48 family metallopeptidase [Ahrensia sp.]|nr:M48 family metallopeptidase [Ahrensia sp.]